MRRELIRLATFQDVHGQFLTSPCALALLGFSYQKESDSLVCSSCSCSVDYRQESHSLAQLHLKSSLRCRRAIEQESENTWRELQRIWKSDECREDARDGDKPLLSLRQKDDNVDAQPQGDAECAKHMDDASKNKIQDLFASAMQRAERDRLFNGNSSLDTSATAALTVPNASIKGPGAAAFEDTVPLTTSFTPSQSEILTPLPFTANNVSFTANNVSHSGIPQPSTAIPSIQAHEAIDRTKPNFHQMKKESARLSTFYDWPVTAHAQPAQIARTGYFYTGSGDRVQCAFGKEYLKNWVKGDIPDEEHRRHFPKCPFVLRNGDDNVPLTAEQHLNPASERDGGHAGRNVASIATTTSQHGQQTGLSEGRLHYTLDAAADPPALPNFSVTASSKTGATSDPQSDSEESGEDDEEAGLCLTGSDEESSDNRDLYINSVRAKTPNYVSITKRIESFAGKPVASGKTPEILASAGFYYSGPFDNVRCYFCDGGLKNWQPDDEAWTEHARWFPRCQYVNKYKSPEFIQTAQIPRTQTLRQNLPDDQYVPPPTRPGKAAITSAFNAAPGVVPRPILGAEEAAGGGATAPPRFAYDPREIRARMDSPAVRVLMDMGYSSSLIQTTLERRMGSTGDDFRNTESLLEAVLALETELAEQRYAAAATPAAAARPPVPAAASATARPAPEAAQQEPRVSAPGEGRRSASKGRPAAVVRPGGMGAAPPPAPTQGSASLPAQRATRPAAETASALQGQAAAAGATPGAAESARPKRKKKKKKSGASSAASGAAAAAAASGAAATTSGTAAAASGAAAAAASSSLPAPSWSGGGASANAGEMEMEEMLLSAEAKQLLDENRKLKDARMCRICMDRELNTVFLPCGHLVCCMDCAQELRDCPMCRGLIRGTVKTFMS